MPVKFISFAFMLLLGSIGGMAAEIVIAPDPQGRNLDLAVYGLGQGGYSDRPMLQPHVEDLRQLRPHLIRLFVQEYYDLLPATGRYDWAKLDRELESIVATGAQPMLCLCMKPRVLFPVLDEKIVHPSSYPEWEAFIEQLVLHVNSQRRFGVDYWEIGNEVEIGERGGCPYLFRPDDYLRYYAHTVAAILRAHPGAKVGGPALGHYDDPIGDALLAHAGAGKVPLHFFSFHTYDNDPEVFRKRIQNVKSRIEKYPALQHVETVLDEWNMSLGQPPSDPGFQPAFVLSVTRIMADEGLTRAAYYQIRDGYVDPMTFAPILSPPAIASFVRQFNLLPLCLGLYDVHGRMRPTYDVFKMMAQVRGQRWNVSTSDPHLLGIAAADETGLEAIFWSYFGPDKDAAAMDVELRLGERVGRRYTFMRLNPHRCVDELAVERSGPMASLADPLRLELGPYEICWLSIER